MKLAPASSRHAIVLVVLSAVIAWFFFVGALFSDLALERQLTVSDATSTSSAELPVFTEVVFPSKYLILVAIAVFGLGSLIAQRRLAARVAAQGDDQRLARAGKKFANTTIVISLALGAAAAISIFLESFFAFSGDDVPASTRLFNTYLPILLYTAFVVTELLIAFVFQKHRLPTDAKSEPEIPAEPLSDLVGDAHVRELQRFTGLAFAVPIIAVAVALIFGLFVFDFTRTAIQVWIWVLIQAGIGVGIVFGTLLAAKSMSLSQSAARVLHGPTVGAKNLNFVFSVIFAAVLAVMSLSYAGAAVEQIRIAPSLSVSVYSNAIRSETNGELTLDLNQTLVNVNGSDLSRGSEVRVELSLAESENGVALTTLVRDNADPDGMFWHEVALPAELEAGTYQLRVLAISADSTPLTQSLPFSVNDAGVTTWPEGTDSFMSEAESLRLMPVSLAWLLSDVLPALLLLLVGSGVTVITLTLRNPLASTAPSTGINIRKT